MNERHNNDTNYADLPMMNLLFKNAMPSDFLLRAVLEEEDTFEGAVSRLKAENITAPCYYIVSGIKDNEGVVIEREPDTVHGQY